MLTIHNVGYQGVFGAALLPTSASRRFARCLCQDDLARGRIKFLKTGLLYADARDDGSRDLRARDPDRPQHGMGLDALLRARRDRLFGIVNGIDAEEWDPATDPHIPARYSADDLVGEGRLPRGAPRDARASPPRRGRRSSGSSRA